MPTAHSIAVGPAVLAATGSVMINAFSAVGGWSSPAIRPSARNSDPRARLASWAVDDHQRRMKSEAPND